MIDVRAPMCWVAGVDGCRGGWVVVLAAVLASTDRPVQMSSRLCATFAEVLALPERPQSIAVDMPIGLLEQAAPGGRPCDREARAVLGRPRSSSVFSPPTRKALAARSYAEVATLNGAGMSKEAFNILPKIREVDALMDVAAAGHRGGSPSRARLHCLRRASDAPQQAHAGRTA